MRNGPISLYLFFALFFVNESKKRTGRVDRIPWKVR
jgi:hypothetical protein